MKILAFFYTKELFCYKGYKKQKIYKQRGGREVGGREEETRKRGNCGGGSKLNHRREKEGIAEAQKAEPKARKEKAGNVQELKHEGSEENRAIIKA